MSGISDELTHEIYRIRQEEGSPLPKSALEDVIVEEQNRGSLHGRRCLRPSLDDYDR